MSGSKLEITEASSQAIAVPENVQIGDFVVARYKSSEWSRYLPWEDFDHVALVSQLNPLKVIEVRWLKPVFPNPIREIDKWYVLRSKRKIITEKEARTRAVNYAREQLNEPYSILASKWSESKWYCSLLIYKSYARTVTGMYLETYGQSFDLRAGPMVTPEDLIDSPRSQTYFIWKKKTNEN